MTSPRFQRIREIVLEARAHDEPSRREFVERACEGDADLRSEVLKLLAHDDPESVLRTGRFAVDLDAPERPAEPASARPLPDRIGSYRILGVLGEGGMGRVYEAEQATTRRRVAVKVVRYGARLDDHHVKLFLREVRALGLLKHPGIAAVHEAGQTDDGEHYLVMELVDGEPLDDYLRRTAPDDPGSRSVIRQRLALFLEITDAIAYAHLRGVIHRDIKPANILVSDPTRPGPDGSAPAPVPPIKVLDFGLARLTDPDVSMTSPLSEVGRIQGTPAYMSPEQVRGDPDAIDIRTDVYSLGVILYEMLTGRRPYDLEGKPLHEVLRIVSDSPPVRADSVVRGLRGDIQTILQKALAKDPERRYQSVRTLADDIERYLGDQPIVARPPSATYQLRKLVARHKMPFAFLATLFVLLVAFGVAMSVQLRLQRREAQRAERISAFLQEMLASADPAAAGRDATVREVLDLTARDVSRGLDDEPDVRATIHHTIGEAYLALGEFEASEEQIRAALDIWKERTSLDDEHRIRSEVVLGNVLRSRGRYAEAESLLTGALAVRRRTLGADARAVAATLHDLAGVVHLRSRLAEAESLLVEAMAVCRRVGPGADVELARCLNALSSVEKDRGRLEPAERYSREALTIRRELYDGDHPQVATSLSDLSLILSARGKHAEAREIGREALEQWRRLVGNEHPTVATSLGNLAYVIAADGNHAAAEPFHREALELKHKLLGEEHPDVTIAYNNCAVNLLSQQDYVDGEPAARKALDGFRRDFGSEHVYVGIGLNNVAVALHGQGRLAEAEPYYREGLAVTRGVQEDHPFVGLLLLNLGGLLHHEGRDEEAETHLREAVALREEQLGEDHHEVGDCVFTLATTQLALGRDAAAEAFFRRALDTYTAGLDEDNWKTAMARTYLGICVGRDAARVTESAALMLEAREVFCDGCLWVPHWKRMGLEGAARLFEAWGRPDDASPYRAALAAMSG